MVENSQLALTGVLAYTWSLTHGGASINWDISVQLEPASDGNVVSSYDASKQSSGFRRLSDRVCSHVQVSLNFISVNSTNKFVYGSLHIHGSH